ncbi:MULTISPECIES: hypothetical protein [Comamonas]|jgi:hypothetical protein|uniref:hypothetical protein n=1 Tax=Comamonas TaxID=283 RepID=UPI00257BC550|nr:MULTISPECIES: hypothetical protein [Comamonas]
MNLLKTCIFTALWGAASWSMASTINSVPSCYAANKLPMAAPAPEREVFILLDQTTPLDASLQKSVMDNAGRLIQPGTAYSIATFSSFGQGRYLELLSAGTLEVPLPEATRSSVGVKVLRSLDACLTGQQNYVRKAAATALQQAMAGISADYAKSDVMASVKEMSARINQSPAPSKILFLVSDMLENSGVSSFYANRNVRSLNANTELQKAASAGMLADLAGARVFVLGAGLVQDANSKGFAKDSGIYRDPKTMAALKDFWSQYFQRSDAKLQEFGMPALLVPVQ